MISFGPVIPSAFTVCSVTRYTGGAKGRILNGGGKNWLHGHWAGHAGVAYYEGWKTAAVQDNVSPDTDWVVMCGTNSGSQLKLVNGADEGTATGGYGDVSLFVNAGWYGNEKSDFAIAEVVVWPRGLTAEEMRRASEHLTDRHHLPAFKQCSGAARDFPKWADVECPAANPYRYPDNYYGANNRCFKYKWGGGACNVDPKNDPYAHQQNDVRCNCKSPSQQPALT